VRSSRGKLEVGRYSRHNWLVQLEEASFVDPHLSRRDNNRTRSLGIRSRDEENFKSVRATLRVRSSCAVVVRDDSE
jgi:hypothetical protein